MAATASLARYLVSAKPGGLPGWTLHEAKRTLINLLGVSLSASVMPAARIMLEWATAEGAAPRASVIGSGLRTSPATAALLNGYLAHLQDYDDT
ncbi:MAG: MmgE/PrpD family protein, partial [Chloroflexi bacterium]|nr:MmgE/PrpD family protein [Chloroflexota bacterium]